MKVLSRSAPWASTLWEYPSPYDYKLVYGGRGSGKTWEVTKALIGLGHQRPLRIGVAREHKVSIEESAQPELIDRAVGLGLLRADCYQSTQSSIDHANGTHIFFIGLSAVSEEDVKGLAMVDILWIEEAHRMSHTSWELVRPTIRKRDAEIWATYNPKYRTDAIWQFAEAARRGRDADVWMRKVTWRDNQFFTPRNNRDRKRDLRNNAERYGHIWEGEPDDASSKRKVLPRALLQVCVDAWDQRPQPRGAFVCGGLDVADTGADWNAFMMRSGPELFYFDRWRGSLSFTTSQTARRAARAAADEGCEYMFYDIGGPGAGIRGPMIETHPTFPVQGCHFGGKVGGPTKHFTRGRKPKTNEQYFFNWAAQAGWNVRLKAEATKRLVDGEHVDPYDCLFVNPELPHLEDVLAQMAQPEFDDKTGKLKIDKQPREAGEQPPPSPDAYDAAIMAFSYDCRNGLRSAHPLDG